MTEQLQSWNKRVFPLYAFRDNHSRSSATLTVLC